MSTLPAFCNTCGAIFSSGFEVVGSGIGTLAFENCQSGPCPKCGGFGHIPDGVYNHINEILNLLSGPQRTLNELEKLAEILRHSREKRLTFGEIKGEVQRQIPQLSPISNLLPKTKQDFYQFISVLIAIVTLMVTLFKSDPQPKVEINEVINFIYQQSNNEIHNNQKTSINYITNTSTIKKVGRNQPCPCGSGKKYKRCHGQ